MENVYVQKKASLDQEIVIEISENSQVDTQALNEEKCEKKKKLDGRDYKIKQKVLVRLAYCLDQPYPMSGLRFIDKVLGLRATDETAMGHRGAMTKDTQIYAALVLETH